MISDVETHGVKDEKKMQKHMAAVDSLPQDAPLKTSVVQWYSEVSVYQDAHKTPFIKEQNKMENDCPMTNQYIRLMPIYFMTQ